MAGKYIFRGFNFIEIEDRVEKKGKKREGRIRAEQNQ